MKIAVSASDQTYLRLPRKTALVAGLTIALLGVGVPPALAASRLVTNCQDNTIGVPGTLRTAVANAQNFDTIEFDMAQMRCSKITLTQGAIAVNVANLTLVGPGENALTIDGNANDRVLTHNGAGMLTVRMLTLTNGKKASNADALGGCVYSKPGSVTLIESTVSGCVAQATGISGKVGGGGIYTGKDSFTLTGGNLRMINSTVSGNRAIPNSPFSNIVATGGGAQVSGYLNVTNSTISNNSAGNTTSVLDDGKGGGIFVFSTSNVPNITVTRSTISSNWAKTGGGVQITTPAPIYIVQSTISGNTAKWAGGLDLETLEPATGSVMVANSTIAFNTTALTGSTGGMYLQRKTLQLNSSIIANNRNTGASEQASDLGMNANNSSINQTSNHNLIFAPGSSPNVPNDTIRNICPQLEPLVNNGGLTKTHALRQASPVINAGSNPSNTTSDQRDEPFPRLYGPAVDIGAFEWRGESGERVFHSSFESGCDE